MVGKHLILSPGFRTLDGAKTLPLHHFYDKVRQGGDSGLEAYNAGRHAEVS